MSETRPIDANALIRAIENRCGVAFHYAKILNPLLEEIDNTPTVDPKDIYQEGHYDGHLEGYTKAINEERPQGDLISREALRKEVTEKVHFMTVDGHIAYDKMLKLIDNAPTVEPERLQGEYVDISKLRLMTVEECAGHTIEYAMGWKACIEWIKKGGAE